MKKLWIAIIAVLILTIATLGLITYFCEDDWCFIFPWQGSSNNDLSENPSGSPLVVPDTWKEYSNSTAGFSIKYDPTLTLRENSTTDVQFYKWGPTQSGQTEIYDGIILSFRRVDTKETLESYANSQIALTKDNGTVTVPLHDSKLGDIAVKQFSVSSLGDFTVIMVSIDDKSILEMAYMVPDPTNAGFQRTVDTILSTIKIIN